MIGLKIIHNMYNRGQMRHGPEHAGLTQEALHTVFVHFRKPFLRPDGGIRHSLRLAAGREVFFDRHQPAGSQFPANIGQSKAALAFHDTKQKTMTVATPQNSSDRQMMCRHIYINLLAAGRTKPGSLAHVLHTMRAKLLSHINCLPFVPERMFPPQSPG